MISDVTLDVHSRLHENVDSELVRFLAKNSAKTLSMLTYQALYGSRRW